MRFYLGVHHGNWLRETDVPLFVSRRVLSKYKTLPVARGRWSLDSGGFTELNMHGRWITSADNYIEEVGRYLRDVGGLDWVAPMDWMCEPQVLDQTGWSVETHLQLTVANFCFLRQELGRVVIPVLQGWTLADYVRCLDLYAESGFDLAQEQVVGVGTVCRRQNMAEAEEIMRELASYGLRLHGFGVKATGLKNFGDVLASADSMAWSYTARRRDPLPGHTHKNCANCLPFALQWREQLLAKTNPKEEVAA